ncbi:MAG: CD225/dispanin family protein [Pseudobutyrivibrio sp.]|nr:CD225/dispanin family protein [Pseudobutyrivibrio sp.]
MAFCSKCGQPIAEGVSFCSSCGAPIGNSANVNSNFNQSFNQINNTVPPDNYLVWAILTTILCCLPFGIVAIVYSTKVNSLWITGHTVEAMEAAKSAKTWSIVSASVGAACIISYIIFILVAAESYRHFLNL